MRKLDVAVCGVGPNIPCLPAVVLCKEQALQPGAYAATGLLNYDDLTNEFNRLNISYERLDENFVGPQMFERALGALAFSRLPTVNKFVHTLNPSARLSGRAQISGAETWIGQLIAKLFSFPTSNPDAHLEVVITRCQNGENWQRHYPDRTMHSVISLVDETKNLIEECFGPFRCQMKLVSNENGLDMEMQGGGFLGVSIPKFLLPKIYATERVSLDENISLMSTSATH